MTDISPFTLQRKQAAAARTTQSTNSLHGGLRVSLSMKNLKATGLEHGDYCRLQMPDGSQAICVAVFSKAADPQKKVAIIDEPSLQELYGLKHGERAVISKLEPQVLMRAERVYVKAIDPVDDLPKPESFEIDAEGIGGLQKQLNYLNEQLRTLTWEIRRQKYPSSLLRSTGVLLHGSKGTGKSLLLSKLADAPWNSIFRAHELLAGTSEKRQSTLRKIFEDAKAHQPSLILFDKLEAFFPRNDDGVSVLATCLANEVEKLGTAQVLIVGTTTRLVDVDATLRNTDVFSLEIEVPVPDGNARVAILKVLERQGWPIANEVAETIGGRTHGFVGRDLRALYENALKNACDRHIDLEEYAQLKGSSTECDGIPASTRQEGLQEATPPPEPEPSKEREVEEQAMEVLLRDFEAALQVVRPTAMNEVFLETPKVRWSDIGGSESVKEALTEVTEWPFKHAATMEEFNIEPERGILLYGPPGCSKTLCAKAVATESDLNFLAVKGAELTSMYVGETERAVREVFRKARAASPSIIFFDEIDSIAASRESGKQLSGLNVLTTLLNEMDGIESMKGVLVLAATNRPDVLDPAIMRPGRFGSILYVGPPNLEARRQILAIGTRKRPLAGDVELDELAALTDGYSGAEIIEICGKAAKATIKDRFKNGDDRKIGLEHFMDALQRTPRAITAEMTSSYENWSLGDAIKKL
ncbi:AAA-domain-containing protein [Saccharata proteae CBS 121410]|uniref:AAA-domain-containing protein n=1 Tax=Saccharata proteae CBS 121410 TaxID=1314787 RepID=A0A9P4HTH0_9PEZI|nr:AAA-domain-containing protein [Saccharata proteae CBS 121410]